MPQGMWTRLALASTVAVTVAACTGREQGQADAMAARAPMGGATYTVVVHSTWTRATHPFEYPSANAITGPHFSGVIGAAHGAAFSLFEAGSLPTPGLEHLSEAGAHSPLDEEIRAAVSAGSAMGLFESGPLRDFADSLVFTVQVDSAHPMVSMVMMIAPSPDWFAGVRNVNLMENGGWVASREMDLLPYDSGGDDGTTYKAADRDTDPKKPTSLNDSRHFVIGGQVAPVGRVRFEKR